MDMGFWAEIRRRVLVEGESKRSVLRRTGLHWRTLEKILTLPEPPGYRSSRGRRRPVLGPFLGEIHRILEEDRGVHRKQRHTARRIFERLREERGYRGGYTVVKDAVRAWRHRQREVFVPLSHPPGEGQVDFGKAFVRLRGEETAVAMFVLTLPYSDACFVQVFPRECLEAFHEGHVRAFEWLGGVPGRLSYDNLKLAVAEITGGRGRTPSREFQRLLSHFCFAPHFCRVRRPNEKGHVETLVGFARRTFLVPVPETDDLETLNRRLREACTADLGRRVRGKPPSKAARLEEERASLLPLPRRRFEARRVETTAATSLSLVRFDRNDYSVPTAVAHHPVTVVGGISRVRIVSADRVVAEHERCWGKEQVVFNPVHYLALLERKPGALDFARPLEDWDLPPALGLLRRRLEAEHGHAGTREYIKVLRLLESCSLEELARAVERALDFGTLDAVAVRLILEHHRERPAALFRLDGRPHLSHVRVEAPCLAAYGDLTSPGGAA